MSTIGPYHLLSALGEGGMGTVFRAQHQDTGETVALKTIRVPKRSLLRGLRREIKTLRRLAHPGIIRILDEGVQEGLPWYTMELLQGQTLRQWRSGLRAQTLREDEGKTLPWWTLALQETWSEAPSSPPSSPLAPQGRDHPGSLDLPPRPEELREVLTMVERLCAPLAFLHGEGLIHRDLKPENLLVRPDGSPVLVDFGLATHHSYGGESSREILPAAVEAGIAGSASYMSPEQIQGDPLDARSDLYSLGVVLYELLTRRRPLQGANVGAVLRAHLTEIPAPPSALVPGLPPALDALCLRLLKKRRKERPGYAEDVARLLSSLYAPEEAAREDPSLDSREAKTPRSPHPPQAETIVAPTPPSGRAGSPLGPPSSVCRTTPLLRSATPRMAPSPQCGEGEEAPAEHLGVRAAPSGRAGSPGPASVKPPTQEADLRPSGSLLGFSGVFSDSGAPPYPGEGRGVGGVGGTDALKAQSPPEETWHTKPLLSASPEETKHSKSPPSLSPTATKVGEVGGTDALKALSPHEETRHIKSPRSPGSVVPPRQQLPTPRPYLYHPSLSGREAPLFWLGEHLSRLERREGGLVLLGGESGVGKTRLALELAREATKRGLRVLTGEAQDRETRDPLGALSNPLREVGDAARERGSAESERLFGRRGRLLSRYEPSLAKLPGQEKYPEPLHELPPEAARLRLYAGLGETLFAFAEEQPLLLVLDDLQWADELSLGFLRFFLRGGLLSRWLLVLGTYRSEEVSEELSALLGHPGVTDLRLDRLSEEAVARIVGDMLALSPPPEVFSRFLAEQSEGNPFFVAEYLRTAVEEGLLFRDARGLWQLLSSTKAWATEEDYAGLPLPRNLRALVERRLAGLPGEAARLLEAAAVLGREAPLSCLEEMLSLPGATRGAATPEGPALQGLESAVRDLLRRQIFEETEEGSLRFLHAKLREVAYAQLSREARPGLHRRAALALSQLDSAKEGDLGYHWEQAGEPERARPHYLAGARKAAEDYSHQEAEKLYRAYLRLCHAPTPESLTVRNELGEKILFVQGRMEEAEREHQQALLEARHLYARGAEGESLRLLGRVRWKTGRVEEALDLSAQALALHCEVGDRRSEGICLGNLAGLYRERGRPAEALRFYVQALALHREVGDRRFENLCLGNLALLYHEQGMVEEALGLYTQALALLREVDDRRYEGICLVNLANLHYEQGKVEEALSLYTQALVLLREVGDRRQEGVCLGNLANLHHEQDRGEEALGLYAQALALHREVGNRRSEGICLGNLANLHHEQGRVEEALGLYTKALALHREVGDRRQEGICLGERATLELWSTGEEERTRALFTEGEALLLEVGEKLALGKLLCGRGHLALALGESAEGLLARVRALALALDVKPESELGKRLARLVRAQAAFVAGEAPQLFRGYLLEDIPAPVQAWLKQAGQLSPS